jgi:UDP-N-acetylmuramate dehydrogenase
MIPSTQLPKKSVATSTLIQENIPLADKNWFGTGGHARYFAQPTNSEEFAIALEFARQQQLNIFILGSGANILISDDGFDGLVIRPALKNIECNIDDKKVLLTAGSGLEIGQLISWCLDNSISGLEEFSGIPGTVGGSVYINLHYFEFLLEQFLAHARVIHRATGIIETVKPKWFNFGYNQSTLQKEEYYLLDATFSLKKATDIETAYAKGRSREIIRHRDKRYPVKNTCGSFFRNFHENEVTLMSNGKKMIFVAYYLDKIGVKGQLQIGNAIVSYQHANMIVNKGNATSTDIIMLARTMQKMVQENFGIIPQAECRLIGFKEYPLLS